MWLVLGRGDRAWLDSMDQLGRKPPMCSLRCLRWSGFLKMIWWSGIVDFYGKKDKKPEHWEWSWSIFPSKTWRINFVWSFGLKDAQCCSPQKKQGTPRWCGIAFVPGLLLPMRRGITLEAMAECCVSFGRVEATLNKVVCFFKLCFLFEVMVWWGQRNAMFISFYPIVWIWKLSISKLFSPFLKECQVTIITTILRC